ncbi:MAG: MATE family efflux transporter [Treponema sp.]|jgi:putative MATE family efflux protein|nr:MATE family efflux transporter [Treponema sp.]
MSANESAVLTEGNPAKRIIFFALPLLAGELLHISYTMIDAFVVGRWVGINGLAAVGASYNLICFVWGFIFGLTGGFAVILTQRIGAAGSGTGNEKGIKKSAATSLFLSFTVSVIAMIILLPLTPYILSLINTPPEIMKDAVSYAVITFSGTIIFMLSNMFASIIYAAGDSVNPLIFFTVGTVCNIIFDILFVAVFSWGVPGAAAATVLSQLISAIITLIFLLKRFRNILPTKRDWKMEWKEIKIHLSLGIAMGLQRCIVEFGNILIQAAINSLGAVTIAAVSAAQRIRGLNMMPVFALSRAVTTYTAQNYGAGKMDRVYSGLRQSCFIALFLGIFMAALNQFTGRPIVSLFLLNNADALDQAALYILITGYTVFLLGIMLVFRSTLQGLGKKSAPILCSIMETAMSIFAAFALIPALGFLGVCLVNPLSWLASGIPLFIAFALFKRQNRRAVSELN